MAQRVTIKSIAQDLGISHMTVSRALSNHPSVREETRKTVLERAAELGYVRSAAASAMRGDATGIVGLLLGSPTFGPRITGGLAAAGIQPGTANFNSFVFAATTVIDSGDPINWGALAAATKPILLQEVVGSATSLPDQVIPMLPMNCLQCSMRQNL